LVHPVTTVHKLAGLMNLRKTTLPGGFFVYGQRLLFAGLIRQHNKLYLKDQNVFTLFPLESNIITCIMPRPYIYIRSSLPELLSLRYR
ncbi:hypothetical protein ACNQ01_25940, partial [Enterobacter cloacae complex sp.6730869]